MLGLRRENPDGRSRDVIAQPTTVLEPSIPARVASQVLWLCGFLLLEKLSCVTVFLVLKETVS